MENIYHKQYSPNNEMCERADLIISYVLPSALRYPIWRANLLDGDTMVAMATYSQVALLWNNWEKAQKSTRIPR